jgi:hypothetical protein
LTATTPELDGQTGGEARRRPARLLGEDTGVLGIVAVGASQTAVLTGVLYYFGWARTNAFLEYFGLDPTMVGYDTTDYVLRSIGVAFPAAVGVSVVGLAALVVHRGVVAPLAGRRADGTRWARRFFLAVLAVAAALLGALGMGMLEPQRFGPELSLLFPLVIVVLTVLVGYLDHLRRTYLLPARAAAPIGPNYRPFAELRRHQADPPAAESTAPAAPARALVLLLAGLGLLGAFWAAGLQADAAGRRFAEDLVDRLPAEPQVVLFTEHRLQLDGPGVQVAPLGADGDRYRFQYSGIRTLIRTKQALLLIPVGWQPGRDRVFVVPDDGSSRVDIISPPLPQKAPYRTG